MGCCGTSRAPGLVTRGQIAVGLRDLGVAPGDTVMIHAAVSAIGWIVGGPAEVLRGVFDAVGGGGTVMAYVGWDGSPYDVTIGLEQLPPQLAEVWPAYDPATAGAVRSWGVLAEILRAWPGALRSPHPDQSFAAVGPRAAELVDEHPLQYGMGAGSPLAKLCATGGKVLLLGSPLHHATLLHHAEHLADVPDKRVIRYWAPILSDGGKAWVRIEEFDTGGEGCLPWFGSGDMFDAIVRDYLQGGRGAVGPVGAARSHLFDAADLVRFAVEWIEARYAEPIPRSVEIDVDVAGPDDHAGVLGLFERMDEESAGSVAPRGRLATRVDEFLESSDRRVLLARVDGAAVGVLVALRAAGDRGVLEQAFVDPGFRRRGVLREMEIDAAGYLRDAGCHTVQVHVRAENALARHAWRSLGYAASEEFLARPL